MYLSGTATNYIIFLPPKISVGCGPGPYHQFHITKKSETRRTYWN